MNALIYYLIFSAWLLGGFFYVVEVPLLKERFSATAAEISAIFLLSVISNIVFMVFFRVQLLNKKLYSILYYSTVALIWLAPIYCFNQSKALVPIIIIFYGALNGVFNISYTTIIQQFSTKSERLTGLLVARFLTQFAILTGAVICFYFRTNDVYKIVLALAVVLSLPLILRIVIKRKEDLLCGIIIFLFMYSAGYSEDKILKVKTQNIPVSIKSSEILDSSSALILKQVFDSLYVFDENNFLKPILVKKQQWSNGFKKLVIELDTNRNFSDGTFLTSYVAAESLGSTIKELGEGGRWASGTLEGFSSFLKSKNKFPKGIVPKSQAVIEFNFSSPTPSFIQSLASPYFLISKKATNGDLVGTGSYVIRERDEKNIKLNAVNRKKSSDGVETIVFSSKEEYFSKNDIDLSFEEPLDKKSFLKERNYNYLQTVVLMLNTKFEYFKTSKNRCTVGNLIHLSFENSEYSWKPIELGLPFSWSITQNASKINNQEKNSKSVNLEIMYANSAAFFNDDINDKISNNLRKKNINVKFKKLSIKDLIKNMSTGNFQAAVLGYAPDFPSSDSLLTPFIGSNQQYNFSGYSNEQVDNLLAQGRDMTDKISQNEIYKKVFLILNRECPIDYLGTQKGKFWAKDQLHIPPFSSLGYHFINFRDVILNR